MSECIVFVSGCNSHYFSSWFQLYKSIIQHCNHSSIYFYDLGLSDGERDHIKKLNGIIYRMFDFTKYPDWVNVKNDAGQWAWKAQCILEVMNEHIGTNYTNKYVIWCDSRNKIDNDLKTITDFIYVNGIYSNTTSGTICKWTVPQTIKCLGGDKYINLQMRNAALPCFNINLEWVREFIREYALYSLTKECIFPTGSSRANHRQDQSILSILYYKYKEIYNFKDSDFYGGISIHTVPHFKRPFCN